MLRSMWKYTVKVASMQWLVRVSWNVLPRDFAEDLVELKFIDVSCEISHVSHIGCNMVFAPSIKVLLCSEVWRSHT